MTTVLVTGASGFLGAHVLARLLDAGHDVRATVRVPERAPVVEQRLRSAGVPEVERVTYVEADLLDDAGWESATDGAELVLHLASAVQAARPGEDEADLILPSLVSTLRVLRAARLGGAKRVVMTSSFAAIGYGHGHTGHAFTEDDWTNIDGVGVSSYVRSRTIAERVAWDFVAEEGAGMELTVINPVGMLGPAPGPERTGALRTIASMLDGSMRVAPPVWTNVVDVRDVADLHLRAMTASVAGGQRYLAAAGAPVSLHDIALVLRSGLGEAAAKAPTATAPPWMVRLLALVTPQLRDVVPQLGVVLHADATKAREDLDWSPRPIAETVLAAGESILHPARPGDQSRSWVG